MQKIDYDTNPLQPTEIHLASDHAGFRYKEIIAEHLRHRNYAVVDHGAFEYDGEDDYVDYIASAAMAVAEDPQSVGIILGGSGQGEAMLANKFPGVRAMVFVGHAGHIDSTKGELDEVVTSRQDNDANILSIGARFVSQEDAIEAVDRFLETTFSGEERHLRRIGKMDEISKIIKR